VTPEAPHFDVENRKMALLAFITGKQGAGKSWVAKQWARSRGAERIDVDAILIRGGPGIPGIRADQRPTAWDLWENAAPEIRKSRLHAGFEAKYASLENHAGDLVVEGAILCNDWLYDPLVEVLTEWMPAKRVAHHLYPNVSSKRIHANVHERADREPGARGHEKAQFPDEDTVEKFHSGFDRAIRQSRVDWKLFSSSEELLAGLETLWTSSRVE
jgi:hypothetical protein